VVDASIREIWTPFEELQLEHVVGQGASATVYKATFQGRVVAVKKINKDKVRIN
jgi:predicted Ser/Thr protein kinase